VRGHAEISWLGESVRKRGSWRFFHVTYNSRWELTAEKDKTEQAKSNGEMANRTPDLSKIS
jgi:hypothetical protein